MISFSPADVAVILAAAIAAIGAVGAASISLANGRRLSEIHILVNSNLSTIKSDLLAAKNEIARLNKIIADLYAEND